MDVDDDPADDLDRISALPDDLLHVILSFLRDEIMATRTAVLSRRWRHVWTKSQELYFVDWYPNKQRKKRGRWFPGFVNWALARRGDADLQSLSIIMSRPKNATSDQVNDWICYAMQRAVKTFTISSPVVHSSYLPIVELPSHGRAESIKLSMSSFRLRLPASQDARYEALIELDISSTWFDEEDGVGVRGRTLGDFVSTCCPRLRKLKLWCPKKLTRLVLRADELEELRVSLADDLLTLDVRAPNLRVFGLNLFRLGQLPRPYWKLIESGVVRIVAPRLEEIDMDNILGWRSRDLRIGDLTSVRRLSNLGLEMHGQYCWETDYGFWLLTNCPNIEHVGLHLRHNMLSMHELVDLMDIDAPQLHKVRSMIVKASDSRPEHFFATSVHSLLLMCPGLRSLCIDITDGDQISLFEDRDTLASHPDITLEFLQEASIIGFTGTDQEMYIVSFLFGISPSIMTMTIHRAKEVTLNNITTDSDDDDDGGGDLNPSNLLKIPSTCHGCWHFQRDLYTWKRYGDTQKRTHN